MNVSSVAGPVLGALLALTVVWELVRVVYNLYLSPLARFPGPTWAAATEWWKTYVEVVQQKSFAHELIKLHRRYGTWKKTNACGCSLPFVDCPRNRENRANWTQRSMLALGSRGYPRLRQCNSSIFRILEPAMRYTIPRTAGTRRLDCIAVLAKTDRPSAFSASRRRRSGRMF